MSATRPRALMLAPAMPATHGNGLAMRLGQFLQALTRVFDVDLLVAPVSGPATAQNIQWPQSLGARVHVLDVDDLVDTHFDLVARVSDPDARAGAFARYGQPSLASRLSSKALLRCRDLLDGADYDLIHAARSYCAPLASALADTAGRRPVLTLDLDEDDRRVFRGLAGIAARQGDHLSARWSRLEAEAFARLLPAVVPAFDRVWLASTVDAARLGADLPTCDLAVAPNAIASSSRPRRRDDGRTLLFVGSLGYAPNQDAVAWFVDSIWPRLRRLPGLRFRIVGSDPGGWIRRLGRRPGIDVVGWAPDLRPCYETATLCVAPIRVGAGTRIKILESAAHGVPIVSTRVAVEGLGLQDGRHLWLADTPDRFASAIGEALAAPDERRRRAHAARSWVVRHYDRNSNLARLSAEFRALL